MMKALKTLPANFTADDINVIATYRDLPAAKEAMSSLLSKCQEGVKIDPRKFLILSMNVEKARSIVELVKIGYNMLLSGEKMAVIGSRYQSAIK